MKPLCPICSTHHEKYQAHAFAKPVANSVANAVANKKRIPMYRDKAARRKYMRELMQRVRAIESGRAMPWRAA